MLFRHLQYQVISYTIQQIQDQVEQVMKVIEIGDNEPFSPCIKSFQTTIELSYTHHLKKLIKDNHMIELKYIQQHWQFIHFVNWKTQVIEYSPNREILSTIQQHLVAIYTQPTKGDTSNDITIPSRSAPSTSQLQALNARQNQENELKINNEALDLLFLLDSRLCGVEKPDQVKPHRRSSSSLNKKKPIYKEKKF